MFGFFKKKPPAKDAPPADAPPGSDAADVEAIESDVATAETAPRVPQSDAGPVAVPAETEVAHVAGDAPAAIETPDGATALHAEPPALAPPATAPAAARLSWGERLKRGLTRSRKQLGGMFGLRPIDEDLLEELESTLIMADCGIEASTHLVNALRKRWKRDLLETADELQVALADELTTLLAPLEAPLDVDTHKPFIIMVAGINGSGKTTSIGKLAKWYQSQGKKVLLVAGDTFRAAAREQLQTWGERNGVDVISQSGGDAAAVAFDAVNAARARGVDVVLADTAGRLPTQLHLMEEIAKVRRVIAKADATAPHEVLLVLDANIGQNALGQVKAFDTAIGVTGLVVTKLDGTAKGGVLAAIARQYPRPLRFIGVGEGIDDLRPFHAREYADALFAKSAAGAQKA